MAAIGTSSAVAAAQTVHYLHVGKTGGMAFKHAVRSFFNCDPYQLVLHKHGFRLKGVPTGEKVVFFLRDPVARFVSGFYSRQRQGRPKMFIPWTPKERIAFSRFATPNQLALALSAPDEQERTKARKAMRHIMHVKMPYRFWFGSAPYFLSRLPDVLFVGFQESLADDFARLRTILGLPDEARLPDNEVEAHKNPAHLDRALEPQAVQNLKAWYREDYEFIELCRTHVPRERLGGAGLDPARYGLTAAATSS